MLSRLLLRSSLLSQAIFSCADVAQFNFGIASAQESSSASWVGSVVLFFA